MEADPSVMRRLFIENLGWKLLSVLIAVLLWFFFIGEPELVTSHYAPVLYKNLPSGLEISDPLPDQVRLELKGAAAMLTPGSLAEAAVTLDLSDLDQPGERTYTLSEDDIHLPRGVNFLRATPSQLHVAIDRTATKQVPVQVRLTSPAPPGYHVVQEEVQPATVTITGPENRVKRIELAQTDSIDLSNVYNRAEFRAHAYLSDPQVRLVTSEEVTIRVVVEKAPPGSHN